MKISIIGVGVVGGATAQILEKAHEVYRYDKFKELYNSEENLKQLVKESEVIFICVPTPMKQSGEIDYSSIYNSMDMLYKEVESIRRDPKDILVIIKSTAVSGTTDQLAEKYPFRFVFNPEFLREKHALDDMKNTDRIVIGANDNESINKLLEIYKPIFPNVEYVIIDRKTAEMIKYAANVFLASQIAIANEIYNICRKGKIDYDVVKRAILLDERIGRNINVPGPDGDFGFGGKCFPKDINALIYLAEKVYKYNPKLLKAVWSLNKRVRENKDWLDIQGATSKYNFE